MQLVEKYFVDIAGEDSAKSVAHVYKGCDSTVFRISADGLIFPASIAVL
jgi:hypothetical protein